MFVTGMQDYQIHSSHKREDVEKSFSSALKMWSDAAPLRFIKVNHGKFDSLLLWLQK